MKISYNWIQDYLDFPLPPVAELVEKIGAQLGAVEEVVALGPQYAGVVIAKIVSCQPVPDSDHLQVCTIDDGGVVQAVERDEAGLVQVVCGAPNARVGLIVAWLPPGATVPSSFHTDPFVLGARKLRGFTSNGMIASPQELAIGDNHDGIIELDDQPTGMSFSEAYGLNDTIIDIENKMFTHRPDCFGIIGVAREIAGILGHKFNDPEWYKTNGVALMPEGERLPLQVRNEVPKQVPRLMAVAIGGITIAPGQLKIQTLLNRVGIRPINNIVDATNYFMYLTGQPLHAYDYDKVRSLDGGDTATLIARQPQTGEKLRLLSGKEIEPWSGATLIATESQAIGLGGVMGGADTEVDDATTNIILECATFEMYSTRRTSMNHGIFSEAVTRFTKGQSWLQNDRVLAAATQFICKISSGQIRSEVLDDISPLVIASKDKPAVLDVNLDFISVRLGQAITAGDIITLLSNVGFGVTVDEADDNKMTITIPFWRTDIEIGEDIVEEVGRLRGFDSLPMSLPQRRLAPAQRNTLLELKNQLRTTLSRAGANEVLTYSFVHGKLLARVGQDFNQAYALTNALSPDLQYYRQSLTPSLLEKIHPNVRAGYSQFALFEIGKAHCYQAEVPITDAVPMEQERLCAVFVADKKAAQAYSGAAYYQVRKYLDVVLQQLGIDEAVRFEDPTSAIYAAGRAASLFVGSEYLGEIGEYSAAVRKALKLPDYCAGFELDTLALLKLGRITKRYQPLPKFPKIEQDICLRVPSAVSYAQIWDLVQATLDQTNTNDNLSELTPVDIYQNPETPDVKQITLRIGLTSFTRTLTDAAAESVLQAVADAVRARFGGERV